MFEIVLIYKYLELPYIRSRTFNSKQSNGTHSDFGVPVDPEVQTPNMICLGFPSADEPWDLFTKHIRR